MEFTFTCGIYFFTQPVSCFEYSRLCRVDGRMDALIEYLKSTDYVNLEAVKAIIGKDNFEDKEDV